MRFAFAVILASSLSLAGAALAILRNHPATGSGEAATLYDRAAEAARAGNCAVAFPLLDQAMEASPDDADVHALLGYCLRRTGKVDEAFAKYRRALELRPEFPEARQYLGEAHIQAALREVAILRGYGEDGREELDQLVSALREAADSAGRKRAPASSSRTTW